MGIFLRELSHKDIETINVWRNDKSLIDQLGSNFRFVNIETDEQWFERYMQNRVNQIRCAIINEETNLIIGVIYLLDIDFINCCGELHIFIGDKNCQGKGYGSIAIIKMMEHAFSNLNLNRISLTVLEENIRAINTYKKCGFLEEGVMRQCVYKNKEYKNLIIMSILKTQFTNCIRNVKP